VRAQVSISEPSWEVVRVMAPLIFVSLANVLSGLSGTKKINLPMFTVLRRFSILLTLLLERFMLNVHASERVQLSVFLMIFGAFIAAIYDLAFNLEGYLVIFLNNIFTALTGVITKRTVNNASVTRMSVLFHSSWVRYGPRTHMGTYIQGAHK
jgi:solute carrier family 35 protein